MTTIGVVEQELLDMTQDLDVEAFWKENALCQAFTTDKPRCSLSFSPDDHWVFEFVEVPSTLRYYHDPTYRNELHKQVNQITAKYVGQTFFGEDTWEHQPKRIENLFKCEFSYTEGSTPWLRPATDDADEFVRILDQAERTDLRTWSFPEAYLEEWERRRAEGKPLPKLGTGSRGPATIMTSVIDPTVFLLWLYDYPDLIARFRDILVEKMIEFNRILRQFSSNDQPGWWITDDNCALFSPALYRRYCFPVLEKVLEAMAPGDARRYQHSDSAMAHLLDQQYELGIREVNYGPEVDAGLIREKMPDAYIHGQMPPLLLRNGRPEEIRQRVLHDFRKAGASGGLNVTTAGSLAAGTGVGRMRWLMWVVQNECLYRNAAQDLCLVQQMRNCMSCRVVALLFDLGDTLMVEESEVKDAGGTTLRADLVPGMAEALHWLKERGYGLALVADSRPHTPANVLRQHGLYHLFDYLAISDVVGVEKPGRPIFQAALEALRIPESDYNRVAMVGNNLERDVVGANRLGLISIYFHDNDRRRSHPLTAEEEPQYTVSSAQELVSLIARLERQAL